MSTTPTPRAADAQDGLTLARERTRAYLEAAGLDARPADELTARILDQVTAEGGPSSPEVLALAALRLARRAIADQAARAAKADPAAPSIAPVRPLAMPRRTLRSFMDWRLAASTLRRLLPARAPRRVRHGGHPETQASARLSLQARRRRLAFLGLILLTTAWGVATFVQILGVDGLNLLDLAHTAVFSVLLLWLAQSFWTLAAGTAVLGLRLLHGRGVAPPPDPAGLPTEPPRTALIVPIYNEDTYRVFAGLRAMWTGLQTLPEGKRCDLFVLSDTTDPDVWLAELDAWQRFREEVPGGEHIFYRRRLRNVKRKTGNIEDFVTRWGGAYGYMLVLDADCLMTARDHGRAGEPDGRQPGRRPDPGRRRKLVRGHSVFARVLQFAGELYGPLSASGISYWALGEGNYWGHNAIIRVAALRRAVRPAAAAGPGRRSAARS